MTDWLARYWPQISTAVGAVVAVVVGFVDVETAGRLGVEWDRGLIVLGIGALLGTAVPLLPRASP